MQKLAILVIAGFLVLSLSACQKDEGTGEKAGKEIDKAAKEAGQALDKAADAVKDSVKKESK